MIEPEQYCRDIEAYLCRKNDGHLIRIVGPVFEQVSGWAQQAIPLSIVCAGIDRFFERYYRKGPRRRPVRVEFCEADVLDAFDDWRRAVGVPRPSPAERVDGESDAATSLPAGRRRVSLTGHIEHVIARLTALRASGRLPGAVQNAVEQAVRELDILQGDAHRARGAARETVTARLEAMSGALMMAALDGLEADARAAVTREARDALEPFRDRMTPDAYRRASAAAVERQVRDRLGLPSISFTS